MKLLQLCATISFFFLTFYFVRCHSHSHEPPHLKYTREVNEAALNGDDDAADHQHSHGGCSHGHGHHEDNHHHSHSHNSEGHKADKSPPPVAELFDKNSPLAFLNDAKTRLWVYSIGSTLLISIFPCFILAFIPIQASSGENSPLLKLLLAFGAGGLLGDAFLHLIPHATPPSAAGGHTHSYGGGHDHSHEPHDMSVGQWVVTGFMVFFIVEKFVRILRGDDDPHGHLHAPPQKPRKVKHSDDEDEELSEKNECGKKASQGKSVDDVKRVPRIRVAAYLNLVADFMHNFTDGLAIGASFGAGPTVGIVTMVTVLVHEIPHEVGDFAILVQSGYSKKKAMCIQLCTALGAMAGCVVSLWSVDAYALAEAAEQSWVLPFTAGGFIYIATVSVIPELLERSTFWQSVCETAAIVFGVFLMYLIAFYE